MSDRKRVETYLLALLAICAVSGSSTTHAEEGDKAQFEPIGQEAYEAVAKFYDYDRSIPLQARIVDKDERDTTTREKVIFRGIRGFMVPAYLEIPRSNTTPSPVILLLHGWSGSKDSWWKDGGYISGGNMRRALLDQGFAVLALDAQAHGERIAENDYAMVNDYRANGEATHRNYFTLEDIVTQTTVDYRRALDYLETRDDIDVGRVGLVGYSMGGVQAFLLTAVDSRIKAAVSCVPPSMAGNSTSISPKDYARGIGERPFLMLMGREDSMCRVEHAEQLLAFIPGNRKQLIFFDAGHKLPTDYVPAAEAWLGRHIGRPAK